jgi:CRISPR-associated exonuclease Cas4
VVPPGLEDALRAENIEKQNENLRLLYVACTRAMELLIVPDFTWSNDASWARLLDFKLNEVPELNIARLPRATVAGPPRILNQQTAEVFAAEQSTLKEASPTIRWFRPSDGDPDVIAVVPSTASAEEEPLQASSVIEGGRTRGVILHKLLEELLTGELEERSDDVKSRAVFLLEQLTAEALAANSPHIEEMAGTALRTLSLPELMPFRDRLVPEVPIHGAAPTGVQGLIVGRADAVARTEDGSLVVFDWKSDVAPRETERSAYRQQLRQYLHVLGTQRGAIVYMTSGYIDWIVAS